MVCGGSNRMANTDDRIMERGPICKQCKHRRGTHCTILQRTGAGNLFHPYGINNPRARCPIRKWLSIPSFHAILIDDTITPLNDDQKHYWTKYGVRSPLEALHRIYFPEIGKLRSEILEELKGISLRSNGYPKTFSKIISFPD